jgi:hypothetical protein
MTEIEKIAFKIFPKRSMRHFIPSADAKSNYGPEAILNRVRIVGGSWKRFESYPSPLTLEPICKGPRDAARENSRFSVIGEGHGSAGRVRVPAEALNP